MYEGTTKNIANKVFDKIPQIHVCDGIIKNYRTGTISHQTDVIIYFGNAELIPQTTHYIVPIENVIATIEVKKQCQNQNCMISMKNKEKYMNLLIHKCK